MSSGGNLTDTLVFSPPVHEDANMPMLNAGLGAISGWLKEEGYEFDQKSLLAEIRSRNRFLLKEDIVDLSVFTREDVIEYLRGAEKPAIQREANKMADILDIDSYSTILASIKSDRSMLIAMPILKERCQDKLVIIGGPLTMTNDLEIARLPFIDYGVVGDGEIPVSNILEHEFEGRPIENNTGIVREENGELIRGEPYKHPMEMKARPYFERDLLKKIAKATNTGEMLFPYQLGRGCTQDCSFCNYFENQKYQYKSPEKVVRELKEIKEETGIKNVYFTDSNLFNDPNHVEELAEKMIEEDLDINWGALSIILPRPQEFFEKLSEAGCTNLLHGIESASDSVLHRMRKAQTRDMIENTLEKERNAGIKPDAFFICDYLQETKEEFMETIDFFRENDDLVGATISTLSVFESERMPIYSQPDEFEVEIDDPEYEDFIDRSFARPASVKEKGGKAYDIDPEFKRQYMKKKADWNLYLKNYARRNPVTFLKTQFRKFLMKDYQDYTWLYA